ncbi:putative ferulic acid Esterase/Feruloyl esterase [Gymnopus androsaceus JB14]|uniref:Carboxylic ester hydrolase n=1 Tax=Gymnopus androsaceus JB14 TaxID=1447944 RepID=A0A6A4GY60_9AGAR|nr:putative ferulic acid Esterase/Feruloyl esterase [Gymnopus androsaceus JB14]
MLVYCFSARVHYSKWHNILLRPRFSRIDCRVSREPSSCNRPSQVVFEDTCRIALYVSTSNNSGVNMEAWLPRKWTGRFLSTGNGGLSGCIQYEDMAYGSALGFATVGTNNGHNGTSGEAFLNNPEVVEDFAYRSVLTGVSIGKTISKQFYSVPHAKSYYMGCSTGGRQGLKAAQDFPEHFDGIIAGAPATAFNAIISWQGYLHQITGPPGSPSFVSPEQWADFVHPDILDQCDTIDGVKDGILEDPNLCDYKPERLICPSHAKDRSTCLSGEQAKAIRKIFSPFYGSEGELWYPRMQPGSLNMRPLNGKLFTYTDEWFRYAIYNDPDFNTTNLNLTDFAYSQAANPFNINTWNGDLSSLKSKSGKLLTWHGQADGIVPSSNSERYHQHVSQTMNLPPVEMDSFYRFFRVSGMGHCRGGPGAWAIGQSLAGVGGVVDEEMRRLKPDSEGEEGNVLMAMVRWVEQGIPPEDLIGLKYVEDDKTLGVKSRRSHCRYPMRNVYDGVGDGDKMESWKCK